MVLPIFDEFIEANEVNAGDIEVENILSKLAIFKKYHKPTDTWNTVKMESIALCTNWLLKCILLNK